MREAYDSERDQYMESCGWTVLRFTESQVQLDVEGVLEAIAMVIDGVPGRPPYLNQ